MKVTCPMCDGSGIRGKDKCQLCNGSGEVEKASKEQKKNLGRKAPKRK